MTLKYSEPIHVLRSKTQSLFAAASFGRMYQQQGCKVMVTGHSLGGYLAEVVATSLGPTRVRIGGSQALECCSTPGAKLRQARDGQTPGISGACGKKHRNICFVHRDCGFPRDAVATLYPRNPLRIASWSPARSLRCSILCSWTGRSQWPHGRQ